MKTCTGCSQEKAFNEFAKKGISKGVQLYRAECKKCVSEKAKEKYSSDAAYREKLARRAKASTLRRRILVFDYLKKHPCVDCGNSDIRVLEFDHVRGEKARDISKMTSNHAPLDEIRKEIEKCDVRCANCHRIATAERGEWMVNLFHGG